MSSNSGSYRDDDAVETAMMNFGEEIFTSCFIMSMDVRRQVARRLLSSGKFVDYAGMKFDMLAAATRQFGPEDSTDPFDMQRQKIDLFISLTSQQQTRLVAANPDVKLVFHEGPFVSHGPAYAWRIIDTQRCFGLIDLKNGTVLDVGGNYATHAMSTRSHEIHSCTLLEGEREFHRQATRRVGLEYADIESADFCTNGTECCDVRARHGVSIHALPDIDPDLWPRIFQNHGLEYLVAVFHYDPAIDHSTVGYMPDCEMHWYVDDDKENIHFHFEGDSSHGYSHKLDWLKRYSTPWMATMPGWDYVLYYQIDLLENGRIQSSFTRLEKVTLGYQEYVPTFRYLDLDESVELFVPQFDPDCGYSIRDPRAYDVKTVSVPIEMFSHIYRYGISNDTERPDLPLTLDHIKSQTHSYNYVRKVNASAITVSVKLGHKQLEDIALGMYLLIVKRAAMNQAVYSTYTTHMLNLQRRWGDSSSILLAARVAGSAILAPYIMLAESFTDVIDIVAVHMRAIVTDSKVIAASQEVIPFRRLAPVTMVGGLAEKELFTTTYVPDDRVDFNPDVNLKQFYDLFKDAMTPEARARVEKHLESDDQAPEARPPEVNVVRDFMVPPPVDRQGWVNAYRAFESHLEGEEKPPPLGPTTDVMDRIDPMRVGVDFADRIYEYSLYCSDVGQHVVADAKILCADTWLVDAPNEIKVKETNIQLDSGIRYFRIERGVVQGMTPDDKYDFIIDPRTLQYRDTYVKNGVVMAVGIEGDHVFSCESMRIFNYFSIANCAYRVSKAVLTPRNIEAVLYDGVPGCGKTYRIKAQYTLKDIIVVTVRDTRDTIYAELCDDDRFRDHVKKIKDRVRTIDSANKHSVPLANTVYVDEGLMSHSGGIAQVVEESQPTKLVVYGDNAQIGFIDRGSRLGSLRFESLFYWTQIVELNESLRCPADSILLAAQFYPERRRSLIKTMSPVMRSIQYKYEPDLKSATYTQPEAQYRYVTIMRADRGRLVTIPGFVDGKKVDVTDSSVERPVYSVHEVQGKTIEKLVSFRLNIFNAEVFNSPGHLNVMFTRHRLKFVYASPCTPETDPAAAMAVKAMNFTDDQLRSVMLDTPSWLQERFNKLFTKYNIVS